MPQEIPIPLRSLDSRSDRVRPFGRALSMQNVDIEKANEVKRRKGYIRRLDSQLSGPVTLLASYPGICGRVRERAFGFELLTLTSPPWGAGYVGAEGGAGDAGPGEGRFVTFGGLSDDTEVSPEPLFWFDAPILLAVPDLAWRYGGDKLWAPVGCRGVLILRSTTAYPTEPDDPDAVVAYEGGGQFGSGPLHGYDGRSVRVKADQTADLTERNYYSAWADYGELGYFGPLNALVPGPAVTREDDFNRADGTLTNPPYDWWTQEATSSPANVYANRFTVDSREYGSAWTPRDLYLPISAQATLHFTALFYHPDTYWRLIVGPSTLGGGYYAQIHYDYNFGADRWRFRLYNVAEGPQASAWQAGAPGFGTIKLVVTDTDIVATYDGNAQLTLSGSPNPAYSLPFLVQLHITTTHPMLKYRRFDNFLVTGHSA